jgi:hypothetical protein
LNSEGTQTSSRTSSGRTQEDGSESVSNIARATLTASETSSSPREGR